MKPPPSWDRTETSQVASCECCGDTCRRELLTETWHECAWCDKERQDREQKRFEPETEQE